jgi:uncharacterized protein (DUF2236 family)
MSDPPIARLTRRRTRREVRLDDGLMGMALLLGPANVIMHTRQAWLRRDGEPRREGRVDLYPIKRARTTFTHLVVAMAGTTRRRRRFAAR